jgi:hypothetical protein
VSNILGVFSKKKSDFSVLKTNMANDRYAITPKLILIQELKPKRQPRNLSVAGLK